MNTIRIIGKLKKSRDKYQQGCVYHLTVARKSGTVDTLMVMDPAEDLPEDTVLIKGHIKAEYIRGLGVPAFIVPDTVTVMENADERLSDAYVEGKIKEDPVCRTTHNKRSVSSILVLTDDGPVPVLLWGKDAREAATKFRAGDMVYAKGRMQSRSYPKRDGTRHTTYELSAYGMELCK